MYTDCIPLGLQFGRKKKKFRSKLPEVQQKEENGDVVHTSIEYDVGWEVEVGPVYNIYSIITPCWSQQRQPCLQCIAYCLLNVSILETFQPILIG